MKATPVWWVGLIAESSYKLKNAQLLTNQSGHKVGNVFVKLEGIFNFYFILHEENI